MATGITGAALKMAWKMVDTIFPRYGVSRKDADRLLNFTTAIALEDLTGSGVLEWKEPLPDHTVLFFKGKSVRKRQDPSAIFVLKTNFPPRETRKAADRAEQIFLRYAIPELEIATLFSALPCLGLDAIQEHLVWKRESPFPELGWF